MVVIISLLAFVGCTSMRPVKSVSPNAIQTAVEVGDEVEIVTTNGKLFELEVTRISDKAIHGVNSNGKHWKVPFTAVESLKVEELSGAKIGGGVIGVLLFVGLVGWAASEGLENVFGEDK